MNDRRIVLRWHESPPWHRRLRRAPLAETGTASGLRVEALTMRFGGLVAVDDVSFHAPVGEITGLIGPNGAGKTTTFNACSGLLRPSSGAILLHDRDVTALPPQARARLGLGRTFQRMELFDTLTVRENARMGREARLAGGSPVRHVRSTRAEARELHDAGEDALALCGIGHLATRRTSALSTGERRLVELARAVASGASMLLLDEPSSGLDHSETRRFGEILRELVLERRVGLLLVEHDMELVMSVCNQIYVLDFGKLLCHGSPEEVSRSDVVRAAYLGDSLDAERTA